ncbi:MAG: glycine--tRNA ligase subunit beta [Candidatus Hydrogenedentota bacterium]
MKYLLEAGVEEIPAGFLPQARRELSARARTVLNEAGSGLGAAVTIRTMATPRRLVLALENLPARTADATAKHKGPPLKAAYDAAGKPTKAAEGFAKKIGAPVDALRKEGEYVVAEVIVPGRTIEILLQEAVPRMLSELPWPKSMRWNASGSRFVRPVRWIVSLLDERELPVTWAGIDSSRNTYLRRSEEGRIARAVAISSAAAYEGELMKHGVLVSDERRTERIRSEIGRLAGEAGGKPVLMEGEGSFAYLADHVEDPCVMRGEFDADYAELPREVLELTMWRHQKYVPVSRDGKLLPFFLITANRAFGPAPDERQYAANVRAGNRRVLSARLADARYFWTTDLQRPLEDRTGELARVTYQKDAGSVLDRVNRIELTARRIAPLLGVVDEAAVHRAARLAKADLTTKMVFEFPELQGVIGRRLAEAQGERDEIARAIEEHYGPLGADPRVPRGLSAVGALAEKADTLETIFGAGLDPTGSADPFGLRRAAIGIIRILLEFGRPFDIGSLLSSPKVKDFLRARLLNFMAERHGTTVNVVDAVASVGWNNLPDLDRRAAAAAPLTKRADYADLATSFKRVMNILDETREETLDGDLLQEAAEKDLFGAVLTLDADVSRCLDEGEVERALSAMASIRPAVDKFFDDVLVNAEDPALRRNRKALLRNLGSIFLRILDFSRL